MAARDQMLTREFLQRVREVALADLGDDFGPPTSRILFSSLQFHFGEPRRHYEVWPVRKTGRIEIGLHLEGPREWSRPLAAQLAAHADELRSVLGSGYELEDWTASWSRLHLTVPLDPLTDAVAEDLAARLAHLVRAVEPVIRALPLAAAPSSESRVRPRWRGARSGPRGRRR